VFEQVEEDFQVLPLPVGSELLEPWVQVELPVGSELLEPWVQVELSGATTRHLESFEAFGARAAREL
jgi:hypothetical protein